MLSALRSAERQLLVRPTDHITERLSGPARLVFGNLASQVYLALVAVASACVAVDTVFVNHQDASFAGVWLFLLSAPTVFVFFVAGETFGHAFAGSAGFMYAALVFSVLIQSAAIGAYVRLLRGNPRPARPQEI